MARALVRAAPALVPALGAPYVDDPPGVAMSRDAARTSACATSVGELQSRDRQGAVKRGDIMNINFPLHMDGHGRTAAVDTDGHIRQMIEQLLFTSPGERVNRPGFGSGLLQLVFAPGSEELVAATQFLVQGALQQWMGDLILVDSVQVANEDSTIRVTVRYVVRREQQSKVVELVRPVT